MAEMAYIQASFTVTPVAVQGQAGEVQGEQRDAGAKEQTQTHKRDCYQFTAWSDCFGPYTSALFLRKGSSHEKYKTSLSTAFSF